MPKKEIRSIEADELIFYNDKGLTTKITTKTGQKLDIDTNGGNLSIGDITLNNLTTGKGIFTDTTEATNADGSIKTDGGISVQKKIYSGSIGSSTQVLFNDSNFIAGDAGLTYNKATDVLTSGALTLTNTTEAGVGVGTAIINGGLYLAKRLYLGASSLINFTAGTQDDYNIDGSTNGWFDILGEIEVRGTGSQNPPFSVIFGSLYGYEFDGSGTNHECFTNYHIPHSIKPNSSGCHFHIHIMTNAAGPYSTVAFLVEYTYASSGGVFSTSLGSCVASGTFTSQYQHLIIESTIQLPNVLEVDGIIICRITRRNGFNGDVYTGKVWALKADCHIRTSKISTMYKDKLTTGSFYV